MSNGVVTISPAEAVRNATDMKKIAGNLEELLNNACTLNQVRDKDYGGIDI